LEHGTFIDDVDLLREVREKGIWLVVNMWNTNPRRLRERDLKTSHPPFHLQRIREAAQAAFKNFRMFLEHGIPVAVGADCHHGRMAWQIESMVEAGMAPLLALRAATIGSACACGLGGEVGSLAAGKTADIVVCSGDLERDIGDTLRSVRMVVKCGTTVVRDGRVVA
jgi:imidazolonepropionase-like amidohydrolase